MNEHVPPQLTNPLPPITPAATTADILQRADELFGFDLGFGSPLPPDITVPMQEAAGFLQAAVGNLESRIRTDIRVSEGILADCRRRIDLDLQRRMQSAQDCVGCNAAQIQARIAGALADSVQFAKSLDCGDPALDDTPEPRIPSEPPPPRFPGGPGLTPKQPKAGCHRLYRQPRPDELQPGDTVEQSTITTIGPTGLVEHIQVWDICPGVKYDDTPTVPAPVDPTVPRGFPREGPPFIPGIPRLPSYPTIPTAPKEAACKAYGEVRAHVACSPQYQGACARASDGTFWAIAHGVIVLTWGNGRVTVNNPSFLRIPSSQVRFVGSLPDGTVNEDFDSPLPYDRVVSLANTGTYPCNGMEPPPSECPPCPESCIYDYRDPCNGMDLTGKWRGWYSPNSGTRYTTPPNMSQSDPDDMLLYAGDTRDCVDRNIARDCMQQGGGGDGATIFSDNQGLLYATNGTAYGGRVYDPSTGMYANQTSTSPPAAGCTDSDVGGWQFVPPPDQNSWQNFMHTTEICGLPLDGVIADGEIPVHVISWLFGWEEKDGTPWTPPATAPMLFRVLYVTVTTMTRTVTNAIEDLTRTVAGALGCFGENWLSVFKNRIALGFAGQWIAADFGDLKQPYVNANHYQCPQQYPGASNALDAFLGNAIDAQTFECWTRIDDHKYPEWRSLVEARRSKHTEADIIALWRRGEIDFAEASKRMRGKGWMLASDVDETIELTKFVPPITDILRMMVRDVADPNAVNTYDLAKSFPDKWQGPLAKYGEWQGVSEEVAKLYWMAHWQLLSPTQLFEYLHRHRHSGIFGTEQEVTKHVEDTLILQDILPFWVPRLMALSYRPLTRVDTRRAYELGALDRQAVWASYIDQGYSDENAETLTKFNERQLIIKFAKHPAVNAYANLLIADNQFVGWLQADGANQAAIDFARDRARLKQSMQLRKRCVGAVRKRFLRGELTADQVRIKLDDLALDGSQIDREITQLTCERDSRDKSLTAAQLCSLKKEGAITDAQLIDRLVAIGYSTLTAGEMAKLCQVKIDTDIDRVARAKIRALTSDTARADREKRRRDKYEDYMHDAAKTLWKKGAPSITDAVAVVKSAVNDAQVSQILPIEDAVQSVVRAADSLPKGRYSEFRQFAAEFAEAERAGDIPPFAK